MECNRGLVMCMVDTICHVGSWRDSHTKKTAAFSVIGYCVDLSSHYLHLCWRSEAYAKNGRRECWRKRERV